MGINQAAHATINERARQHVHEAVAVEHARACLCLDVVACVAKYHDDQVAQFWLRQLAA